MAEADNPLRGFRGEPSYEGLADLFMTDALEAGADGKFSKRTTSFSGDIVELFANSELIQPQEFNDNDDNADEVQSAESEAEDADAEDEEEEEPEEEVDESTSSMDKFNTYNYSDSDDDEESERDALDDDEEQKPEADLKPVSQGLTPNPDPKRHGRGPSFGLDDMFSDNLSIKVTPADADRDNDNDDEDRAPSDHELEDEYNEHDDYYAITAYYGIEEDDDQYLAGAGGAWGDSRRSSLFGDYGRVHSRKQSKRMSTTDTDMRQRFEA